MKLQSATSAWRGSRSCGETSCCRRPSTASAGHCSGKPTHQRTAAQGSNSQFDATPSRRSLLAAVPALLALAPARQALAFTTPPPGFRYHQDKLDGYSFFYPEDWLPVTTSGNDVFFRNPFNIEENLFVDVSSPSSSKYTSLEVLGSPEEAAKMTVDQFLEEFMSTRIGVRREGEAVSSVLRTGADGRQYLDIQTRVKSYASRNQLAVTQAEIDQAIELEWDRVYLTVLGTANNRLYSMRLQTPQGVYAANPERLLAVTQSFTCKEVSV